MLRLAEKGYYVIGFEKAIGLLATHNSSGYFIIPPELAYGEEGLNKQKTLFYFIKIK